MKRKNKIKSTVNDLDIYEITSISSTRFRQKMRMEVDTLYYTTEGVLSIECKDRR